MDTGTGGLQLRYEHTESRAPLLIASISGVVALSFVTVLLRFVARGWIVRKIGMDDWFIGLAWVLSFAMSFTICFATRFGLGQRREDQSVALAAPQGKARFAYTLLYNPALMATKTSILVFYLGLSKTYRLLRIANWATLAVVNVAGLILTLLIAFQCSPVSATFQSTLPPSFKCISTYTMFYASGPVNLITDLAILVLPMPILTSLRLPKKQKIILIVLFAAGGFVTVVGLIRIHYFEKAVSTGLLNWDGSLSFMWTSIEVNVGIFCASIPMIKPLVARLFPGCIGVSGDTSAATEPSSSSGAAPDSTDSEPPAFFNLEGPKSALSLDLRASIRPVCWIAGLFFIWGFAYSFVDSLNKRFEQLIDISTEQYIGLHAAYFSAYAFAPLVIGGRVLKRYGFKATIMVGLTVSGCGCLVFWPSAVLQSYAGFCVSMTMVGTGMATVECAANLFIVLCGPDRYSEIRLSLVQGVQPVGVITASVFASKVLPTVLNKLEGSSASETSLVDVQWIYLAFGLFSFLLAFAFYYVDIPEVKDEDFGQKQGIDKTPNSLWKSEHGLGFLWGYFAQLCYVGAQEVLLSFSILYLGKTMSQSSSHIRTGQGLFITGRFIATALMFIMKPRWVLLLVLGGAGIFSALAMTVSTSSAQLGMLLMIYLFEASAFPIIFALSLRGLGIYSKDASMYQISSAGAGAIFPGVYYAVFRHKGGGVLAARYAMCVPTALFAGAATYPVYLCIRSKERERLRRIEKGARPLGSRKRAGAAAARKESEHIEMVGLC